MHTGWRTTQKSGRTTSSSSYAALAWGATSDVTAGGRFVLRRLRVRRASLLTTSQAAGDNMQSGLHTHVARSLAGLRTVRKASLMLVVACIASACSDAAMDGSVTSPTVTPNPVASSSPNNAKAYFHARNHLDWVGRAHNKALDDFAAMVREKGAPKDLCTAIADFMSAAERLPGNGNKGTAASRRATSIAAIRASGMCNRQFATNGSNAWLAAAAEADGFSYEANQLFDRIEAAGLAASTSSELASSLSAILTEADSFGEGVDRDGVYAVASVAQSSFEYWEVEALPLVETVNTEYGTCLGQYNNEAYALETCAGITNGTVQTTRYKGFDSAPLMFLAQGDAQSCEKKMDLRLIAATDVGGAVAGVVHGIPGGLQGMFLSAIKEAGVASTVTSWTMAMMVIHCRRTNDPRNTAIAPEV